MMERVQSFYVLHLIMVAVVILNLWLQPFQNIVNTWQAYRYLNINRTLVLSACGYNLEELPSMKFYRPEIFFILGLVILICSLVGTMFLHFVMILQNGLLTCGIKPNDSIIL